jgi:hypothetical protein
MTDPLGTILGLVAEGRITAEEAAPLIDALQGPASRPVLESDRTGGSDANSGPGSEPGDEHLPTALRIEITEGGRRVVNLRVPLGLGRMALDHVPGLSTYDVSRIREALDQGLTGSLLVVNEGDAGDGVRIILE